MKTHTKTLLATTALLLPCATASHAATLSIGAAPTENILVSNATTGSFTRAFSAGTDGADFNSGRGQFFTTPGTTSDTHSVASFTVKKNSTQTFNSIANLRIWVFEYVAGGGNPGWNAGDGIADGDAMDGTNLTALVNGDDVSIANLTLSGSDYLTFVFDAPVSMQGDSQYGFLIGFQGQDSGNNSLLQLERGDIADSTTGMLQANGTLSQDMTFYVSVVPEPGSLALLGLGGLLIGSRRRRD